MWHRHLLGRTQEAVRALAPAGTPLLGRALLPVATGQELSDLFPRPARLWEAGGDRPYCIAPPSKSGEGQSLLASVSWLSKGWCTGSSLPEREQGLEEEARGERSEAVGLQVQGDRRRRRLHLLLEPVEVLG